RGWWGGSGQEQPERSEVEMPLFQCTFRGILPGGEAFAHGEYFTSAADLSLVANATALHFPGAFLVTATRLLFNTVISWVDVRVAEISPLYGSSIEVTTRSISVAGTGATAPLPPQVSVVVTRQTALAGRSHRGRAYLPCPVSGQLTATGQFNSTGASTLAANYAAFLNAMID